MRSGSKYTHIISKICPENSKNSAKSDFQANQPNLDPSASS